MTAEEFTAACAKLGLGNQADAADFLGVSLRTAHGYANGSPIPVATGKLLRLMVRKKLKLKDVP